MADTTTGLDQISEIAEVLTKIIDTQGKIEINNPVIWSQYLHRWTNKDWENMLAGFRIILENRPDAVKQYHKNNFERAVTALKKDRHYSDRALDTKNNKRIAWAMINTFREVLADLTLRPQELPNKPKSQPQKNKVTTEHTPEYTRVTVWHNLFEDDARS